MFGLNNAQLIGRLGADATISHLTNGSRVANVSIATDESYLDRNSGDKVDRTEWHRIVTFQDGLVEMLKKHAKKGRLVYVSGKLQTRKWRFRQVVTAPSNRPNISPCCSSLAIKTWKTSTPRIVFSTAVRNVAFP